MALSPVRLEPTFSGRPWGSRSLAPFFPEMSNLAEPIGEAWMTASESRFANGPFFGERLGDAWPAMSVEWTGAVIPDEPLFPLLVKFIFPEQKLSVQVHPDDDYAASCEQAAGGRGKTEMWYALRSHAGAEVLVGLKPGVTREIFERAIASGSAEHCLHRIPLSAGEAVYIPAGTVHTIGPGLVLCEIQEQSDLTYRVYDYNRRDAVGRSRPLHIEKALTVMEFGKQRGGKIDPVKIRRGALTKTYLAACRYFATEKWEFGDAISGQTSREHFDLLIILEGSGVIRFNGQHLPYGPIQVWMLPAALGAYDLVPDSGTTLLRTYVPPDLDEVLRALAGEGMAEGMRGRLVHE